MIDRHMIHFATNDDGERFRVWQIWFGDALASLQPIDKMGKDSGDKFRTTVSDLYKFYHLFDSDNKPL